MTIDTLNTFNTIIVSKFVACQFAVVMRIMRASHVDHQSAGPWYPQLLTTLCNQRENVRYKYTEPCILIENHLARAAKMQESVYIPILRTQKSYMMFQL